MQHFERTFKLSEKYIKDIELTSEYYSQERNVRTSGHFLIIFFSYLLPLFCVEIFLGMFEIRQRLRLLLTSFFSSNMKSSMNDILAHYSNCSVKIANVHLTSLQRIWQITSVLLSLLRDWTV